MISSENRYFEQAKTALIISSVVTLVALWVVLVWFSIQVLFLIFGGILLAVLIRGISKWVGRRTGLSYLWAVSLVVLAMIGAIVLLFFIFGNRVHSEVQQLMRELPNSLDHIRQTLRENQYGRMALKIIPEFSKIFNSLWQNASSYFFTLGGFILSIVLIIFLGIYLAFDPGLYFRGTLRLFPPGRRDHIREVLGQTSFILHWWLVGRLFSMALIGVLTGVGLWALGMPLALTFGFYAGLITFIPYLGPILSFVPVALLSVTMGWSMVLYVLLLYLIIQTVESYILTPMVFQRTVLIPPLLTLIAQVLLGMAAGVVGIVFALPVTATLIVFIKFFLIQDLYGEEIDITEAS